MSQKSQLPGLHTVEEVLFCNVINGAVWDMICVFDIQHYAVA